MVVLGQETLFFNICVRRQAAVAGRSEEGRGSAETRVVVRRCLEGANGQQDTVAKVKGKERTRRCSSGCGGRSAGVPIAGSETARATGAKKLS